MGIFTGGPDDQSGMTARRTGALVTTGGAPAAAVTEVLVALVQPDACAVEIGAGADEAWLDHHGLPPYEEGRSGWSGAWLAVVRGAEDARYGYVTVLINPVPCQLG